MVIYQSIFSTCVICCMRLNKLLFKIKKFNEDFFHCKQEIKIVTPWISILHCILHVYLVEYEWKVIGMVSSVFCRLPFFHKHYSRIYLITSKTLRFITNLAHHSLSWAYIFIKTSSSNNQNFISLLTMQLMYLILIFVYFVFKELSKRC